MRGVINAYNEAAFAMARAAAMPTVATAFDRVRGNLFGEAKRT